VNARLSQLQSYPFERLRALLAGLTPAPTPIRLSIGEPQHRTPDLIGRALTEHLDGLSVYPATAGLDQLREALAGWFERRYRLKEINPRTQVLPVNGTREALFAFGQAVIDPSRSTPAVVSPNPFYQIYEGAALLSGAMPVFLNQTSDDNYALPFATLGPDEWARVQLTLRRDGRVHELIICAAWATRDIENATANGAVPLEESEWLTLEEAGASSRHVVVIRASKHVEGKVLQAE